jgi:hypothetical protein
MYQRQPAHLSHHMNTKVERPRVVATALHAQRIGDRTIVTGCDHDFEAAIAVIALRGCGVDAVTHVDTDRHSLVTLAAGVADQAVDVIVARGRREVPSPVLRTWLLSLRRASGLVPIVCLHDDGIAEDALAVADHAIRVGDDDGLCTAVTGTPRTAQDASTDPSPYLSRVVPASAATRVGIDLCRPLSGQRRPADAVAAEVSFLERRCSGEQRVVVRGLAEAASDYTADLLQALATHPRRRVRLVAEAELERVNEPLIAALVTAGIGLRLNVRSDCTGASSASLPAVVDPFVAAGLEVELHLVVDAADDLCSLGDAARAVAPGFTYEIDGDDDDATHSLEAGSATAPALAGLDRGLAAGLQQLLCGAPSGSRSSEGARAVLWLDQDLSADQADWLLSTTSVDGAVWATAGAHTVPLGLSGPWRCEGDPAATASVCTFGGGREIELIPYGEGRNTLPFGPLVLTLTRSEDIRQLIADADEARRSGTFPTAVAHPLSAIGDSIAFADHARASADLRRLVVRDGHVSPGLNARPVGRVGDGHDTLLAAARAAQSIREERRGCAECSVASRCSRDGSLELLLSDDEYCELRRGRPWLSLYVAMPALLRWIMSADPEIAADPHDIQVRVSGFGGPLFYPASDHDEYALAVIEVRGRYFLADSTLGRCARLSRDLAEIVDGLIHSGSRSTTARWLADRRGLDAEEAEKAVLASADLVGGAGLGAGLGATR